jgi:hypothetical protein
MNNDRILLMDIELLCYNSCMDNPIFVEYIIIQYDLTHNHLITGVMMMVNYPLLKIDSDYQFSRKQVINLLHHHDPVYIRQGDLRIPLQLVENDGDVYIRQNSESVPWDL